ncbi:MAG: hypothetical protein ACK5ZS_00135 [bacterium]
MASLFPDDPANALRRTSTGPSAFPSDERPSAAKIGSASAFPDSAPETDRLRQIVPNAARKNPEQTARVFRLQTKTGLPAELIERNLDTIEAEVSRRDFNAETFRKQSPLLSKWLAENPKHAELANDDLANLGALEWIVTAPQRAWQQGRAQVELGNLRAQSLYRDLSADEHKRLAELRTQMARGGDLAAESWFGKALVGGARQLPMTFAGLVEGAKTGIPASMGAASAVAVAGQMGPQAALPEEIATVPAAALTGYYIGQTAGSMRFGFHQEAGHAYEEFSRVKDELGRPLDDGVARMAAIAAGAINAPIEAFQINTLLRSIPGADRLAGATTRSAVRQALASPTVRGALKDLALNYGKVLAIETSTEVVQRAVTILSGELGKAASGQNVKMKTGSEIAADLGEEAVSAAQAFTFLAAPGPVVRAGRDVMRAREAAKNEQFFTALGEGVQQSQTFKRMPEKVQEFIQRATQDGPIENVYVDAETFTRYWQGVGVPPAQVAEEIGIGGAEFEQAAAEGGMVRIPTAAYATRIAPTEHNAFFSAELRLGPDEMNAREAREYQANLEQQAVEETVVDEGQQTAEQSAARIREDVIGQLVSRGYDRGAVEAQAAQVDAAFRTIAQRAGMDPFALYQRYGLTVNRPMPEILRQKSTVDQFDALLDRLRRGDMPTAEQQFGIGLTDMLRERGGLRDQGGELKGFDADKELKPFQKRLVRDDGLDLDTAREMAAQAGYLDMDSSVADFLTLIDEDIRGNRVYPTGAENAQAMELAQALEALDRYLNELGLDLNALTNEQIKASLEQGRQDQARTSGDVQFDQAMQTGSMSDKRGAIRFGPDRKFAIDLFEKANLSTFLHESGHFYLEVIGDVVDELRAADPASLNATQQQMVADYDKLLKWLKVKSRAEIGVEQHEQWARGIEAYFMEGKAPSAELRHVFARFRSWLVNIYKSLTSLNVELSDEVRGVMDRIFATDQEIEAAEREAQVEAMFTDADSAGMSETEFKAYRETVQAASDRARDALQAKLMRVIQRERQAWWKQERETVRGEVAAETYQQREYIALSVLQRGTMPDGSPMPDGIPAFKLDRAALVEVYGPEFLKRLPRPYVYAAKGGIAPDAAADLLGFKSGDEMVMALANARPMKALIEAETDARMRERYPDPLTDGTIGEQAKAAVHNEERSKVIAAEMRALAKKRREVAPFVQAERREQRQRVREGVEALRGIPPLETFRNIAQGRIEQMMVRDIRPGQYLVAARKASRLAIEAASKQDYDAALIQKQRELLNVELYRAAQAAREDADSIVDYMRKFGETKTRARIGKAGQDYLDQIDGLLDRFSFARIPLKAAERRASLAQWIAQKERDGQTVDLPDDIVNEALRKDWRSMTYLELSGLRDSVRHIEHLARLKNKLLTAQKQRELDAAVAEITTSIRDNAKSTKGRRIETRLPTQEAARQVEGFFASHRKLSSLLREMDGFKDAGPLWEYLMRPVNEAGNREAVMNEEATARLSDIFGVYKGKDAAALYRKTHVPAIDASMTKMARLMVALNWGNADSRQKVMDGYGWSEAQVQSILDTLDERDWQFVQSVWDFVDSYWPQIKAKEERVNGIAPEKVEAMPVDTRFGQFKGGYFPLKYDDRQSAKAGGNKVKEIAEQMTRGAFARSTTKRGHTQARVEGVRLPIRLDFGVIFEHTQQVVHDLSHHEMLVDAGRILGNKEVQDTIYETYGEVVYEQIKDAMQDIAAGDIGAGAFFERAINHVRTGTTIAFMGWNISTAMLQPFGLTQSMARIGVKWVGRGLSRWMRDAASMENTAAWIAEKSDMMRLRSNTQMREINEIRNRIGLNSGKLSGWIDEATSMVTDKNVRLAIADSFFWMIYKGQQVADIPTWIGAYEKAMAENYDEATAIALADQAVLDAQGGGQIKDLSGIQRGGPLLKLWTNFYSYFNVTWNNTVEATKRTNFRDPASIGRMAVDYLLLYTIPATLGALMKEAIKGGSDDEDELLEKVVRENLSYMVGVLVGLREIGSAMAGFGGYEGPAGARFFSSLTKLAKQVEQGDVDGAFLRYLNEAAGILLHYPAGQVRRAIEGAAALWEGDTANPAVLLVGPPKE